MKHDRCILFVVALFLFLYPAVLSSTAARSHTDAKVTIVFTNDTLGVVEPCGCAEGMRGGLPRRATLLKKLRQEDPKLILLDAGNLLGSTSDIHKAHFFPHAYRQLGYHAVVLGTEDTSHRNILTAGMKKKGIVTFSPDSTKRPSGRIFTSRGVRVGVIGITPATLSTLQGTRSVATLLASLRSKCDFIIMLSTLGRKQDEKIIRQGLGGDIFIGNREWRKLKKPLTVGKTIVLPTSERGEYLNRIVMIKNGASWQSEFRRFPLDDSIADDPAMSKLLNNYYNRVAQELLAGKAYRAAKVGYGMARACAFCHRSTHKRWRKTKHSQALRTLKNKQRHRVPECLACHSEYYRRTKTAPHDIATQGVECASCHGDGIMLILRPRQLAKAAKPDEKVCRGCHTPEKSPKFNFKKYKAKIKHWS